MSCSTELHAPRLMSCLSYINHKVLRSALKVSLVVTLFLLGIIVVKRFVYFDTIIPEVYPCLLHGWTENEDKARKV